MCSAVVLAGGLSRRMGQDKCWIKVEGQTLLERQVATLKAAGAAEIWIAGRIGVDYSAAGCPVAVDREAGLGPLGGIEAGLANAKGPMVLFVPVDMPRVDQELIQWLWARCLENRGVVPRVEATLQPLFAIYPKSAHALVLRRLKARRLVAGELANECAELNLVETVTVPPEFVGQFANWNYPEDKDVR